MDIKQCRMRIFISCQSAPALSHTCPALHTSDTWAAFLMGCTGCLSAIAQLFKLQLLRNSSPERDSCPHLLQLYWVFKHCNFLTFGLIIWSWNLTWLRVCLIMCSCPGIKQEVLLQSASCTEVLQSFLAANEERSRQTICAPQWFHYFLALVSTFCVLQVLATSEIPSLLSTDDVCSASSSSYHQLTLLEQLCLWVGSSWDGECLLQAWGRSAEALVMEMPLQPAAAERLQPERKALNLPVSYDDEPRVENKWWKSQTSGGR